MDAQCNIPNCRNKAPDTEPFCIHHRGKPSKEWQLHLVGLLQRSREYVTDALEAHNHSEGRELLAEIDEALMSDALYCFTKTAQQPKPEQEAG